MGDKFGVVTDKAYLIIGVLFLVGVAASYIAPTVVSTIGMLLGVVTFLMLVLKGYDREFEVRNGMTGTVSVAVVGLILLIVGLGLFGINLSSIAGTSLGGITPGLPQMIQILLGAIGAGLLFWGGLGTIKELT